MKANIDVRIVLSVLLIPFVVASCVPSAKTARPGLLPADAKRVDRILSRLTLEEKVGQLIACRFTGDFTNLDAPAVRELDELVVRHKIGGLILFGGEALETAFLVNHFQRLAKVPLLLASDFERGMGNQVTGATLFPPLMAVGAAGSEALAYDMGRITAIEGRALGIHMTYAPVVDVNINPDNPIINTRAVGEDPALVGRLARAFIRGCQENGMIATAKHFPGHGDTAQDSHSLLPTIAADRPRLDRVELAPYKDAIAAGVGAVMTAHLSVPALDPTPNLPATLSAPILTGILRKDLGFKGLIVTDALEMAGVTSRFGTEDAALRSLLAGVDLLLLPPEPAKVAASLVEAAKDGRLPLARLDDAVRKVLAAKLGLGLFKDRFVDVEALPLVLAPKASLDRAWQAFAAAATLVKNDDGVLPPAAEKKLAVFALSSDPGDYYAGRPFAAEVVRRRPGTPVFYADGDTGWDALTVDTAAALKADVGVFALFSRLGAGKGTVDLEPKHVALIQKWIASGKAAVIISFGSPYFLRHFPEAAAYLCLYRNTPQTQPIAAQVLFGEMEPAGRLPVSLPGFPAGHGLSIKR
jgi:beta-N-acetylhexosaminidase